MIFDSFDNFGTYAGLHPAFADILTFMAKTDLAALAVGKHPINDLGSYASVNEYNTKAIEDCFIECHRRFIDVQVVARGAENIGVASKKLCSEEAYDEDKDLQKLSGRVDFITLVPGLFAVFFPQDAHEPAVRIGAEAVSVKKIVFKIPV